MQQYLTALRMIPAAGRYLGGLLMALVLVFVLARVLKIPSPYNWFLLIGVVVAFGLFYLLGVLRKRKEKREAREFESNLGLQSRDVGVGKEEIREALAELSGKWEEAVREFREAGLSIYDLPWYLLIGEPQSGKSTTIQNSGLEFPVGTESLSGSGGTRNCDWWFTNEAVILDTAGRFTFQEANAPDQHEWSAFLKLLARHRKECPINGVVVVIPVTSLVEDPVDVIESKAKNIRQKLRHLQKTLGIRFPVFVLVTKTDRILGFTEFFTRLDPIDQRQIFGWSAKTSQATQWNPKEFEEDFDDIVDRVHKMRLKFFHGEADTSKIDKLFVFPEELAALKEPLAQYLTTVFAGSRFEEPLMLRGFYFTSGVQQGRPFALACKELLRVRAGDPEGVLENLEQVFAKSRAFFIRDFYERKVFPEQGLVTKTREALEREKLRKRILLGGVGLTAVILIPLLVWAFSSLRSTVGAVTENVRRAEECLEGDKPCSARQAFDLIKALEANKADLQRKWLARWMFLKGKNNPVVVRYIPAAQAALLSEKIIEPLQSSFDSRAGSIDWAEDRDRYLVFRDGFLQLLRFEEVANPVIDEQRREQLRRGLSIRPLLEFCSRMSSDDTSEDSAAIDEWLQTDPNATTTADQLFTAVLQQFPKIASDNPPLSTRGARDAMLRFWTVDSLAAWDHRLLQTHFNDGFEGFFAHVDQLDLPHAPDRAPAVAEFVTLADAFVTNWQEASDLMAAGRPTSSSLDESPGASPDQWRSYCLKDFGAAFAIAENAFSRSDVADRCDAIPIDYEALESQWRQYEHLFQGSPDADAEEKIAWSPEAVAVHNVVAVLRTGFADAEIQSVHEGLTETLGRGLGVRNQLAEISAAQQREVDTFLTPIDPVEELTAAPFEQMAPALRTAAQLGIAERLLPPASNFFISRVLDINNEALLTADTARDNVPYANDFLVWTQRNLQQVSTQQTTAREIRAIDDAVYGYVRELVDREISAMGGGGGGPFFVRPRNAAGARSWREFVDAVSRWNHIGQSARASSGGGSGIDAATLADFAQQNARLEGLSRELRAAEQQSSRQVQRTGPVIAPTLDRAIGDFKSLIAGLDANALEAWRELAERPETLRQFHAFSELGGVRYAEDLRRTLEEHGADLLASEIRPDFQRSYGEFWRRVEGVGVGYFPFVTRSQLEDARSLYARGDASGGGDRRTRPARGEVRWKDRAVDSGQRTATIILELPTISYRDAEDLFGEFGELVQSYGLVPILSGSETMIDFVGPAKPTLNSLQGWATYLVADGGSRRRRSDETFEARLMPQYRQGDGTFLLERVNAIDFLDADRSIRSSTEQYVDVPLVMNEGPLSIVGTNEDRTSGWTGRLVLEGGDFKIPYFVLVAADAEPSADRRTWEVRVEIPAYNQGRGRLDGIFELSFDRALPAVLPNNAGRVYD